MNDVLKENIINEIKASLGAILENNSSRLFKAMGKAMLEHDGDTPFKFKVGMGGTIIPRGAEADVITDIRWSVIQKDESDPKTVYDSPGLFDKDGQPTTEKKEADDGNESK